MILNEFIIEDRCFSREGSGAVLLCLLLFLEDDDDRYDSGTYSEYSVCWGSKCLTMSCSVFEGGSGTIRL